MNVKEFKDKIANGVWLVDFYATWCRPCKMVVPVVDYASTKVSVIKVDIENSPEIANEYAISAVPTILVFKSGQEVKRQVGVITNKWVDENV